MPRINPYLTQRNPDGKTGKIHLQGLGFCQAVIASELEPGDMLIWNSGATSILAGIENISAQFITLQERYSGERLFLRKVKKDRLIAVSKPVYTRIAGAGKGAL